jgi:Beta-lactamase
VFQEHLEPQIVRWPPGTHMSYSNPGYGVAGYVIEKVSGEPFDRYIRENILAPLGITTGDFQLTDANRKLLAQGYQQDPPQPVAYKNIYLRPAGDMKASPGELAKLVQFFLLRGFANGAALFKPETIARMEYPETTSSSRHGLRLGYGLANYASVQGGVVTHGHDGGIDGFISTYRYMPEENWGYVVLLNSDASGKALHGLNGLAINFLSKDFPKPYQPAVTLSSQELAAFTGYYADRAPRNQILAFLGELLGGERMRVIDGQLTRKSMFDKLETLLPVGKNLFRMEKDPEATMIFFQGGDGRMQFVSHGSNGGELERISSVWPDLRLGLLAICFFLMATSLVFPVVWLLQWALGYMKGVKHLAVRVLPVVAVLTLLVAAFGVTRSFKNIGVLTVWSFLFFAATVLFAFLSLISLWLAVRVPREEIHPGIRVYSLLVSLACCMVTIFLSSWHLIGLRLWAP